MADEQSTQNAVAVRPDPQAPVLSYTDEQLNALKASIAKDLTDAEFQVFLVAARHLGLDPFARQVYALKQGDRMTVQISIDGYRLIAERTGKYAGQVGPQWCGKDGVWLEVWLDKDPPAAAKVGVLRRDFDTPIWGVARFASYNTGKSTWVKFPDVMIAKVAESLALRKAFPAELSGTYTSDEMAQAEQDDEADHAQPPRRRPVPEPRANRSAADSTPVAGTVVVEGTLATAGTGRVEPLATEQQLAAIGKLCRTLGKSEPTAAQLTYAAARDLITQLSGEYQRMRRTPETPAQQSNAVAAPAAADNGWMGWNGLADKAFRDRLTALGKRSVADVEKVLADAQAFGAHNREGAFEYLAELEQFERGTAAAATAPSEEIDAGADLTGAYGGGPRP